MGNLFEIRGISTNLYSKITPASSETPQNADKTSKASEYLRQVEPERDTEPELDIAQYDTKKAGSSSGKTNSDSRAAAQSIFNEIGTSFIAKGYGKTNNDKIDVASITDGLRRNETNPTQNPDLAEFYSVINSALKEMGIDASSSYAESFVKELIKNIVDANKDETQIGSNGINMSLNDLIALDKNNDGSFLEELKEMAEKSKVPAQKEITTSKISDELDGDKNGLITYEELEKALKNGSDFAKLFLDETGKIDKALFMAISMVGSSGNQQFAPVSMLEWLDQDKDGKISKEDIENFKNNPQIDPWQMKSDKPRYTYPYKDALSKLRQ